MTELEKLHNAKSYISSLAEGIDPISGNELPDDAILNDVRLSRCFFFVADILQQVINNGGASKNQKKAEFYILPKEKDNIAIAHSAVSISEFTAIVNKSVEADNRKKLSYKAFVSWLVEQGLLCYVINDQGTRKTHITEKSSSIGIYAEKRFGANRAYTVLLYPPVAQQYLVDNLDSIIDFWNQNKSKRSRGQLSENSDTGAEGLSAISNE